MNPRILGLVLLVVLAASPTRGIAQHDHDHSSPYAGFTDREVKALSAEELAGLEAGAGLGMALAAELNGYPGPRHVLEMAPMLSLTPDQRDQVQEIFDEMEAGARTWGRQIIELEGSLDRAFADGSIDEIGLTDLTAAIGEARGNLRATHLRAHIRLYPVLTPEQRTQYNAARGYGG
jgi:Spy/CpxP family protein refolding chaperone